MSPRIVSSLLILAVVACPLWCRNTSCDAVACCSVLQPEDHACADDAVTTCCGQPKSSDDNDRGPCRGPLASCHGVCGGAVFDKPAEPDDADNLLSLSLIEPRTSLAVQPAEGHSLDVADRWYCRGGNYGRSLRALHMSFLC